MPSCRKKREVFYGFGCCGCCGSGLFDVVLTGDLAETGVTLAELLAAASSEGLYLGALM